MTLPDRPFFVRPFVSCSGRRMATCALAVLTLSAALLAAAPLAPAQAQSMEDLQYRIARLERDLQVLQRQAGGGSASYGTAAPAAGGAQVGGDVAGRLQVRVSELERMLQELTGRVEEAQYGARRVNDRLDKSLEDINFRLQRLEQGGQPVAGDAGGGATQPTAAQPMQGQAAGQGQVGPGGVVVSSAQPTILGYMPQNPGTAPAAGSGAIQLRPPGQSGQPAAAAGTQAAPAQGGLPPGTPEDQYNYAFGLLRKTDYAAAEGALKSFVGAYPKHELAGNAQYWLGETYFVRGDYQKAAVAFLDGYKNYPKSAKGPDNLLKLGITMGNLGQKEQACAALARLNSDYPAASDVIKRRAVAERDRLTCK